MDPEEFLVSASNPGRSPDLSPTAGAWLVCVCGCVYPEIYYWRLRSMFLYAVHGFCVSVVAGMGCGARVVCPQVYFPVPLTRELPTAEPHMSRFGVPEVLSEL